MESLHRVGDELADLGAGTSPVRGVAVAAVALAVGVTIIVMGFDNRGGQDAVRASDTTVDDDTTFGANAGINPADSLTEDTTPDIDTGEQILPSTGEPTEPDPATTAPPEVRPTQEVGVIVVNSKAPKGAAARLSAKLADDGYQTKSPANADRTTVSAIYYEEGFGPEAQDLASVLTVGTEFVIQLDESNPPLNDRRGANILVVVAPGGPVAFE